MSPKIGTRRTVTLAWQGYSPFSLANVQAYAPVLTCCGFFRPTEA
jgi:hypothetical protein